MRGGLRGGMQARNASRRRWANGTRTIPGIAEQEQGRRELGTTAHGLLVPVRVSKVTVDPVVSGA